ncbi:MAG: F0F1 ATP synthase subunit epsilon [Kiritimatiellaceae bacterium]|nr:F0F1 ATP synthase subunit epsilon [Kiritimatiellaceae bacterium]
MAAMLRVKIITPKEVAYDGTALAVTIPAEQGEMQVYQGHIPVLARVIKGIVRIESPGADPACFAVDEGFFRVTQDEVSLLIDTLHAVKTVGV